MLIEFSVANFRSFRERQTISMVAAPRLGKRENVFTPVVDGEKKFPALLKTAVIYGPNASGKSNLLRAMSAIGRVFRRPTSAHPLPFPVSPFKFDALLQGKPSIFEIHFIALGCRYSFELHLTTERVIKERLCSHPKGREHLLYERNEDQSKVSYEIGAMLAADVDVVDAWKKLTPPHALFISQAMANGSESQTTRLAAPFKWLSESSMGLLNDMRNMAYESRKLVREHEIHAREISAFLYDLDVPISNVVTEPESESFDSGEFASLDIFNDKKLPPNKLSNNPGARGQLKTRLTHISALGNAEIDFEDESEGTKNLIGFWLPWTTKETALKHQARCILLVDEIDSSLHPKIVNSLVYQHIHAAAPSQLIFTTHDTHLMDSKLLRRDQIWFTERDVNGATQLRALYDFEGRESDDIEKKYYEGSYRSLPVIKGI